MKKVFKGTRQNIGEEVKDWLEEQVEKEIDELEYKEEWRYDNIAEKEISLIVEIIE